MVDIPGFPVFPRRSPTAHKGDMGRILIIAGSREYQGAGVLAATAALRGGAGLVHLAFPDVLYDCYASRLTEIILHPMACTDEGSIGLAACEELFELASKMDTSAVGPGMSLNIETGEVILRLYRQLPMPSAFDADALNALAATDVDLSNHVAPRVLTPHPGEFHRLMRDRIEDSGVALENVTAMAAHAKATLVYKSSRPIIAGAERIEHVTSGSPALATAGTGDVLTGLIAAMLHRFQNAFDASWVATYIHGRCGTLAGQRMTEECVIASDLFSFFPVVFRELIGKEDVQN